MPRRDERPGSRKDDLAPNRRADIPERHGHKETEVPHVVDEMHEEIGESVHDGSLLGAGGCVTRGSAQNIGSQASALGPQGVEQVDRLHVIVARLLFGQTYDFTDPRRYENTFPRAVFAGSESASSLRVNVGRIDAVRTQTLEHRRVVLFQQCDQQMLGTDVVVVMIAALLFGCTQDPPRGGVKLREQSLSSGAESA